MNRRKYIYSALSGLGALGTANYISKDSKAHIKNFNLENSDLYLDSSTGEVGGLMLDFKELEIKTTNIINTSKEIEITFEASVDDSNFINIEDKITAKSDSNDELNLSSESVDLYPELKDKLPKSDGEEVMSEIKLRINIDHVDVENIFDEVTFSITVNKYDIGSTEDSPVESAEELVGEGSGWYWVDIHGSSYEMYFDDSDRFNNGTQGWLKFDHEFISQNTELMSFYSENSDMDAGWVNKEEGSFYNGDANQWNNDGNPTLARARMEIPLLESSVVETMDIDAFGSNDPDDGDDWLDKFSDSTINSVITDDTPPGNNEGGYVWTIWNGEEDAKPSDKEIKFMKRGDELGTNYNGETTLTYDNGDLDLVSFSSKSVSNSYIWVGTSDAAEEQIDYSNWTVWLH